MRKILATTAALAALPVLAVPTGANAQANPGFYPGVEGGANWLLNTVIMNNSVYPTTGFAVGGVVGYDFVGPRVELEVVYHQNQHNMNFGGRALGQAAQSYKQKGNARVTATGHADRSGPDAYNMAPSLRRANAVKDDRWCRPPTACASRRTAASRSSFSNDPLSPRQTTEGVPSGTPFLCCRGAATGDIAMTAAFVVPAGEGPRIVERNGDRITAMKLLNDQTNGSIMLFEQTEGEKTPEEQANNPLWSGAAQGRLTA
jgi:hypothetical protein